MIAFLNSIRNGIGWPNGTAAAPGFAEDSDPTTGFYVPLPGSIGMSVNGVLVGFFYSTALSMITAITTYSNMEADFGYLFSSNNTNLKRFIISGIADVLVINAEGGLDEIGNNAPTTSIEFKTSATSGVASVKRTTINKDGRLSLDTAGQTFAITEGANCCMGTAVLVAGTVTVATTAVTANSRIFLTVQTLGTVAIPTPIAVTATTVATDFTITSANAVDTSTVAWVILEPT